MYIKIRTIDGKNSGIITISKLTTVPEVKNKVDEILHIPPEEQRLFYRGKQLEDEYKMFDYDIKLNDVIQVMIKANITKKEKSEPSKSDSLQDKNTEYEQSDGTKYGSLPATYQILQGYNPALELQSLYYMPGDMVDAIDFQYGAWFEARIVGFAHAPGKVDTKIGENLVYIIQFERLEEGDTRGVLWNDVRPRSYTIVKIEDIAVNDKLMVNYNIEEPSKRGCWYDLEVSSVTRSPSPNLIGTIIASVNKLRIPNQQITIMEEFFKIEIPKLINNCNNETELTINETIDGPSDSLEKGEFSCSHCKDIATVKCKHCACSVCGGKDNPGSTLICDECEEAFHIWCLRPPLKSVPKGDDDWYCPECKNDENEIVQAGEKLKESKKKSKMVSSNSNSNRDWGKGMACVGRTKVCTIVGAEHFGEIPGIEVGTSWKFRVQVSEDGVHRPHVAGISGRTTAGGGAFSLVLSGGYEDDIDEGDRFMYTGSGGRDLSGNKRTNKQSMDQTLTRFNLALAMNCNAKVNSVDGATADMWKGGKPVRVVRNYKLSKHSKYAPEEGNRYDGLYKVVRYFPEVGKSGFKVWRYELCRDDPAPAPWTAEGQKCIEELGLTMKYPEGYLEAEAAKTAQSGKSKGSSVRCKRKANTSNDEDKSSLTESDVPNVKHSRVLPYKLSSDVFSCVEQDINKKLWDSCKNVLREGKSKFMEKVVEAFSCLCCQELVFEPVTTICMHNVCKACLKRSFAVQVYTCPMCRHELGEKYKITVNSNLATALLKLFPGYEIGR